MTETLERGTTFHVATSRPVEFRVNTETRTIRGLALPFGDVGTSSRGEKFRFKAGAIKWGKVRLLNGHDWQQLIGTAEFEETDEGLQMVAKVAKTARGDEALALAEAGALDGLSVGFANDMQAKRVGEVFEVSSAVALEVSTTPLPGFENAAITGVTASLIHPNKEDAMSGAAAPTTDPAPKAPETPPAPTPGIPATGDAPTRAEFASLVERIERMGEARIPTGPVTTVNEEPIYRFSGSIPAPSGFDFAHDMYLAAVRGDGHALERLTKFSAERLGETFVASTNIDEVRPAVYRPDMFLGQRPTNPAPLHSFFYKGSISGPTPWFYAKLDRAGTNVAVSDHTEGNEPAATNLATAVGATVTPAAVSGRVHITREVGDAGGNPAVSGLVWNEFERTYSESLEAKTAAFLAAASATAATLGAAIAAGATGAVAGKTIEVGSVDLLFTGYNWSAGFGHIDLYKALVGAETTTGEAKYPIINPANRNGISGSQFSFIDLAGYRWYPAAALGATSANASNSWMADPMAVHVWNSGLLRLDKLQEKVEGWDIGAFGYHAGVLYDTDRLRKVAYDPTA